MREALANSLLAAVMHWDEAAIGRERPMLQAFADFKYDEYEQFYPGARFIESLAQWLSQFPTQAERDAAYKFFRRQLIFISRAEFDYLVASVYPDRVRPTLLRRAAADLDLPAHRVGRVSKDLAFRRRERSCLYVGLSDGARTGTLRRSNPDAISNEQVVADYAALPNKAEGLSEDLRDELANWGVAGAESAKFTTVVLLDDFSGSGISYLRENEPGKGKLAKLIVELIKLDDLVDFDDLEVVVQLYVATEAAVDHIETQLELIDDKPGAWLVDPIQRLDAQSRIVRGEDPDLDALIDAFYDPIINDKHMAKGGTDGRYGFADAGLPLVLSHNTPNNSVALLWADTHKVRALFPRVSRHREEL